MAGWVGRFVICWLSLALPAPPAMAAEVRLSVAASLREVMGELTASYAASAGAVEFQSNFGASGALARQVEQGAPADLFISANGKWLDYLRERGLVSGPDHSLAGNVLVVVGRGDAAVTGLEDLLKLERIALVNPKSGPAGEYAEQALKAAGLYDRLRDRLVLAQDVGQAVVHADRGEVGAALVYRTDARLARRAVVLCAVPQALYGVVSYPMALTAAGIKNPAAVAFFDFLRSETARRILLRHDFVVSTPAP